MALTLWMGCSTPSVRFEVWLRADASVRERRQRLAMLEVLRTLPEASVDACVTDWAL